MSTNHPATVPMPESMVCMKHVARRKLVSLKRRFSSLKDTHFGLAFFLARRGPGCRTASLFLPFPPESAFFPSPLSKASLLSNNPDSFFLELPHIPLTGSIRSFLKDHSFPLYQAYSQPIQSTCQAISSTFHGPSIFTSTNTHTRCVCVQEPPNSHCNTSALQTDLSILSVTTTP